MALATKKAPAKKKKVAIVVTGGILVTQRIGCDRMEREFSSDEVAGIRASAEGMATTGKFTTVFVRWWWTSEEKPSAGITGENFIMVKKKKK